MADESGKFTAKAPSARLGRLFKKRRIAEGLTQKQVAGYLGSVSLKTYRNYELGRDRMPLSHIYALSNRLNIDPREIYTLTGW